MPKIVIFKNKNMLIMRNMKCPVALHSGAYLEGGRNSPQHGTSTKFSDHLSLFFLTKYPETTTTKILISCILHKTLAEHVALNRFEDLKHSTFCQKFSFCSVQMAVSQPPLQNSPCMVAVIEKL